MPYKTGIRLLGVARNPANGFPARLLGVQGQIVFVALHDISKDKELTFDYAMTGDEPYEMKCNCGAQNCRRVIAGRDWMKKDIQQKYDGFFSRFIQRRIDA